MSGRLNDIMTVWGKLAGAAAGLALGGPIGALVGVVAGHYAVDRSKADAGGSGEPEDEIAFTIGVIALGAKMAKADGVVTKDEVEAFKQVIDIPPDEVKNVARVFNLAKKDVAGFEAYAGQLAGLFAGRAEVLEDVLDGLFHIAKADGVVHPAELEYLSQVNRTFGFTDEKFECITARHVAKGKGDPYLVLEIDRSASDDEIKSHYRKLVAENHPDRHIAQGLPEDFIEIANEKLAAINAAYDQVARERNL